jgi:hypothetical protein
LSETHYGEFPFKLVSFPPYPWTSRISQSICWLYLNSTEHPKNYNIPSLKRLSWNFLLPFSIQPDKCPRKVNRDIIETMVQAYGRLFGTRKPVFDGRNNMYTRDPVSEKLITWVLSELGVRRILHSTNFRLIQVPSSSESFFNPFQASHRQRGPRTWSHPTRRRQRSSVPCQHQVGGAGIKISWCLSVANGKRPSNY